MNTKISKRMAGTSGIIFLCLLCFEIFSYSSSYEAIDRLTGMTTWATMLAFAFCAVDFAGLAKLVMPEMRNLPEMPLFFLSGAWVLSAIGDTSLTWFVVSTQTSTLTRHILVTAGVLSPKFFTTWLPLLVAVFTWGVQVFLVTRIGAITDKLVTEKEDAGGRRVSRRNRGEYEFD